MADSMDQILHPGSSKARDAAFPHAPEGWTRDTAVAKAEEEGVALTDDHWEAVRALQEYFVKNNQDVNVRALHDALNERFHKQGGLKFLYKIFPKGPVAQGCRLAGLQAPSGSTDPSFGSVQ